jgi:Kef-type K+ transport system membrane component KefB
MPLPLENPVLIFALILLIMLVAPLFLRRLQIPGIIGLIIAGIIVGPKGLHIIEQQGSMALLSKVGLLYLMFLAGMEMDMNDFAKNRSRSIVFGNFTFWIPLLLGFPITYYVLGLPFTAALLLASMFSTHTLLSYPIISRFGLTKSEPVTITIGGTIITDTAVLILMTIIVSASKGVLDTWFWVKTIGSISVYIVAILWGLPRISRAMLRRLEGESSAQYIYILLAVFLSASAAELAGIESIVGAFFAGLALNRLIPHASPLMNRVLFIGNTIFIPFFLIGVGMIVDLRIVFSGGQTLIIALILSGMAIFLKFAAAFVTQKVFGYSNSERNIIFGLSNSHAAATLAVIKAGHDIGLFDESILNSTIILILITCLVSSIITENAAKRLVLDGYNEPVINANELPERILVPVSNPATVLALIDFAISLKNGGNNEPIFPLTVVLDDEQATVRLQVYDKQLAHAAAHAAASEHTIQLVQRVDLNVANGIARAAKELLISKIIMGWNGEITASNFIFGTILENLLDVTDKMVAVLKTSEKGVGDTRRVVVIAPENAELERGFDEWLQTTQTLARHFNSELIFVVANDAAKTEIKKKTLKTAISFLEIAVQGSIIPLVDLTHDTDFLIFIAARKGTISYNPRLKLLDDLGKSFQKRQFAILFPLQKSAEQPALGGFEEVNPF